MPKRRRGGGRLFRRGKTWWLTYYVDGARVREYAGTRDRDEARQLLDKRIGERAVQFQLPVTALFPRAEGSQLDKVTQQGAVHWRQRQPQRIKTDGKVSNRCRGINGQ